MDFLGGKKRWKNGAQGHLQPLVPAGGKYGKKKGGIWEKGGEKRWNLGKNGEKKGGIWEKMWKKPQRNGRKLWI